MEIDREALRESGYRIDDEPDFLPSVPRGRWPGLSRWTVAWRREPRADGYFDETVVLPPGYEWDPRMRGGVHFDDRRYMTRTTDNPPFVDRVTLFEGYGENYLNPYFFKRNQWIRRT